MASRFRGPRGAQETPRYTATVKVEAGPRPQQPPGIVPAARPTTSKIEAAQDEEIPGTCEPPTEEEVASFVSKQLQLEFPDLGTVLMADDTKMDFAQKFSDLIRLLQDANGAVVERKSVLLLAANQLASKLLFPSTYPPTAEMKQELDKLKSYGVSFSWGELGGSYLYQGDLLWVLQSGYADTRSGQYAFVLLLNRGWDTSSSCVKGSDRFRDVIREGEAFLKEHPENAHAATIDYDLAQAYETWWSLGRAPQNNEEEVDAQRYVDGASAGERALDYYNQLTQKYPQSAESACAKRSIDLLQHEKDTRQRRYFCVYD